jgi:hypothetical protein
MSNPVCKLDAFTALVRTNFSPMLSFSGLL